MSVLFRKKASFIVAVMLCSFVKHSSEQIGTGVIENGHTDVPNVLRSENNLSSRSFGDQPSTDNGINIGESFFLNRLRQGDSEAFLRLRQLRQTVDTPMSLLHNFFQVFNRPDLRQRTGLFGLLQNLAVARGLLPNSLAIGTDGAPVHHTVNSIPNANTVSSQRQTPGTVSNPNAQTNGNNVMLSNVDRQASDSIVNRPTDNDVLSSNEVSDSSEIVDPFGLRTVARLPESVPTNSRNMTSVTITNNMFPANNVRTSNLNINQSQTDVNQISILQTNNTKTGITETNNRQSKEAISRDILVQDNVPKNNFKNTATNEVSDVDLPQFIPERRVQFGGRFSSPSTRLQRRKFSRQGSEQRGAHILTRNLVPRIRNETVLNTLREVIINKTLNEARIIKNNAQSNTAAKMKRPSKLNFLLEMPEGVIVGGRTGTFRTNNIASRNKLRIIDTNSSRQESENFKTLAIREVQSGGNDLPKSFDNANEKRKDIIMKVQGNEVSNKIAVDTLQKADGNEKNVDPSILHEENKYILQRVGHIQLDPTDHILQMVGEMNLTLSEANYTIQRVGDLNLGQRRQFVMEVTVNASSAEDKILLQRVGSTDIVPSERVVVHGTGDVRLLTKERVIIQRLGFVTFQTDPLKNENQSSGQQSTGTNEVKSIFRIEPLTRDSRKPNLLFLGNETKFIVNNTSNETVLQFVGDVLSELPADYLNITQALRSSFGQNIPNFPGVAVTSQNGRTATRNGSVPTLLRERLSESVLPRLRESIVPESKQTRISNNNPNAARIHLNSIGRIFSTAEMRF